MLKVELRGKKGKGKFALIDDEDFDLVSKYKWTFARYAITSIKQEGRFEKMYMHRLIMEFPDGMEIDHIDGNGLNNQKSNLRICSHANNMRNIQKSKDKQKMHSKYKGVCLDNRNKYKKWQATIRHNKKITIGYFETELEAAKAYDEKAKELHGEFAVLNF